jgi:hypothetical protein
MPPLAGPGPDCNSQIFESGFRLSPGKLVVFPLGRGRHEQAISDIDLGPDSRVSSYRATPLLTGELPL